MTLKTKTISVVLGALIVTLIAAACGGATTSDIIATSAAANRIENDNATRQAIIDAGGNPDTDREVAVGTGSRAELQRIATDATSTALSFASPTPTATVVVINVPEGPTLTDADNPIVQIENLGIFVPEILKVKIGTTVTWENGRRSASSVKTDADAAEQFDSDAFSKGTFDKEPARFSHTFMILGCHKYASLYSGDSGTGAVCVVE